MEAREQCYVAGRARRRLAAWTPDAKQREERRDFTTYARLTSRSFSCSSFCFCLSWFSLLPGRQTELQFTGMRRTHSRMSFGLSIRFTAANLRVFLALT